MTAFVWLLDRAQQLAVLVAAIVFLYTHFFPGVRREQEIREAWAVVSAQEGKRSSGGRIQALETLHDYGVDLAGLSASGAYLGGLEIPGANLRDANLQAAVLTGANLQGVDLTHARLGRADLSRAKLKGAVLDGTRLENADLRTAAGITREQLENASTNAATEEPYYLADSPEEQD